MTDFFGYSTEKFPQISPNFRFGEIGKTYNGFNILRPDDIFVGVFLFLREGGRRARDDEGKTCNKLPSPRGAEGQGNRLDTAANPAICPRPYSD